MKNYTLKQKILSLGTTYQAALTGSVGVLMSVKYQIISMLAILEVIEKTEGKVLIKSKSDFLRTKFIISNSEDKETGALIFPIFPFIRAFLLTVGKKSFKAKGVFLSNKFICRDEKGKEIMTITKDMSFKDRIYISIDDNVNMEYGFLTAVVLDQKFFK